MNAITAVRPAPEDALAELAARVQDLLQWMQHLHHYGTPVQPGIAREVFNVNLALLDAGRTPIMPTDVDRQFMRGYYDWKYQQQLRLQEFYQLH